MQGPGYLNTAPSPVPGGYGNPAGANVGLPTAKAWDTLPLFGGGQTTLTPTSTLPSSLFPANTGGGATGVPTGLQGLSSGFSTNDPHRTSQLYNILGEAYGQGMGQLLGNMITQGLFNPQVAQALMNAMEPTIARGANDVLSAFGDAGARFSSASAIGLGDYMSQARLGQTAQLANLFSQDQQMQLNLLEQVLPTVHQERANQGGGLFSKILGGLEIVGGAIAAPFSSGASLSLLGSGINTLAGSGGGSSNPGGQLTSALSQLWQPSSSSAASSSAQSPATQAVSQQFWDALTQQQQQTSAGEALGMPSGWQGTPFPLPQ